MPTSLLGLGSNLGARGKTLHAVLADIDALPDVQVTQQSDWFRSQPIGGPEGQDEYLNAAAVIETTVPPLRLLDEARIETRSLSCRAVERPLDRHRHSALWHGSRRNGNAHIAASANVVPAVRARAGRASRAEDAAPGHRLAGGAIVAPPELSQ